MMKVFVWLLLACGACLGQDAFTFRDVGFMGSAGSTEAALPAISFRRLAYTNTTTAVTAIGSSNVTIYANELVLCMVQNSKAYAPAVPTLAGCGLAWQAIYTTNFNDTATTNQMTVFRCMTNATTPTAAITASVAASTGGGMIVCAFTNVDTSGTYGSESIVQSAGIGNQVGTACTITLAALGGSTNSVVAFYIDGINGFNGTAEAGWTEDADFGYNTPASGTYLMHWIATSDNTPTTTISSDNWSGWAAELKVLYP
jgi:hypothetical protein